MLGVIEIYRRTNIRSMWRTNVKRREWTGRILTTDTIITLMNALVVSRIDYCNVYLRQLQRVLNAAARSGSMTGSALATDPATCGI